ncbi:hypothetical protein FKP32DRAFT_1591081 [Trametes sanguinea]|nr:hypothetical protein FKP32DRAFT_1591081 [Trametes sanguinea]
MSYQEVSAARLGRVLRSVFRAVPSDLHVTVSYNSMRELAETYMSLLLALVAGLVLVGVTNVNSSIGGGGTRGREAVPCNIHQSANV